MRRVVSAVSLSLALSITATALPPAAAEPGKPAPELFLAIGQQDAAGVRALLAKGADPNARNTIQMTALMVAASTGNLEVMRSLLEAGADLNASSPFGSALTFAGFEGKTEPMRLLIEKGADVAAPRPDRISVLMLAARAGNAEMVRHLLARKADPNGADNHGSTPLSYAARAGKTNAAKALLEAGAKVDAADRDGWTPLMHAAINGHAGAVSLLLERGANPKLKDAKGRTALLLAAGYGDHREVVAALLKGGAEIEAADAQGRTALALSQARGYEGTAAALQTGGARPVVVKTAGPRTPRQAAEASLRQVEQSMQVFAKRTGCVSCHHEGISRFATGFAKERGYAINEAFAREQQKRVMGTLEEFHPLIKKAAQNPEEIKNVPIVDVGDYASTYGTIFLGLSAHKTPASEPLRDAALVFARMQSPDGDWRFGFYREPVQSSFFTMTAMAVKALRGYAPKEHAAEIDDRIARAKDWLMTAAAAGTEDQAFRLLGLKWAGATVEERRKAIEELRAAQRPDGGWAQLPGMKSDAYATGSALFALHQGGELPASDPAFQRGVRFLLRTQDDDGTWYVTKRAMPANNYFDTGFPYGQSQYISQAAASWATMALILAAEGETAFKAASR